MGKLCFVLILFAILFSCNQENVEEKLVQEPAFEEVLSDDEPILVINSFEDIIGLVKSDIKECEVYRPPVSLRNGWML